MTEITYKLVALSRDVELDINENSIEGISF